MKNELTSISKIKKANKLFFKSSLMDSFKSQYYKNIKIFDNGTYFITSEIYETFYKYNSFHERLYPENKRVYNIRFIDCRDNNIYRIKQFKKLDNAIIYLDKLNHNNGGFRISEHKANMSRLNILNKQLTK